MRITQFEILKVPPSWVWLKVHTDAGIVGLGEPYLENHADSVIAEVRRLETALLDQDPTRIEALWTRMYEGGIGYKGGPVTMSAISGIDMALWDILGKATGQPIHVLLGGKCRDRIRVYHSASHGAPYCVEPGQAYRDGRSEAVSRSEQGLEAWREGARILVHEWGYRCLKLHVGGGDSLEDVSRVDAVAERFAAVREGAGSSVDVAIDIHNPHPSVARQMLAALEPLRPLFVEEPMPIERVDVLEDIVHGANVPIAAGERWMGKWPFFDAVSRGLLAVVQPDLAHAGGITECKKIAAIAEAGYAKVALHCPLSPLTLAACIQLDACLPNFLVQEHNEVNNWREAGRTYLGKGYLRDPFVLDGDGCVQVPEAPGLGIDLDESGLEAIMRRPWSTQRG